MRIIINVSVKGRKASIDTKRLYDSKDGVRDMNVGDALYEELNKFLAKVGEYCDKVN